MCRPLGFWLLMLSALSGFCLSLAYFAVNVSVIFGQDLSIEGMPPSISELHSVLTAWSLDYSAVTPFLWTWFFWLIVFNGTRVKRGQLSAVALDMKATTLPFTDSHVTVWIQLGLIGTLIGFMRIGFKMKKLAANSGDPDASEVLNILLESFGTALLSSLAAVVLAYVIGPIIIRAWRWIFLVSHGDADVSTAVSTLTRQFEESAKHVMTLTSEVRGLSDEIGKLSENLKPDVVTKCVGFLSAINEHSFRLFSAVEQQSTTLKSAIEGGTEVTKAAVTGSLERTTRALIDEARNIDNRLLEIVRRSDENARTVTEEIRKSTVDARANSQAVSSTVLEQKKNTKAALVEEVEKITRAICEVEAAVKNLPTSGYATDLSYVGNRRRRSFLERVHQWLRGGRR
ncbi:MAG: hypothetical protein DVS81_02700 [Candidatus Accumulibacter meliphilus]|uniref:Uncharacterized protein n=1 Tax=Candidatus Accumulibacter meliphilus TaxID=2211374 RepID=A0A369XVF8_9PROT|nr:MAG: hypothetical protein DVS81_02700 [Candidatus Accumulibacter meliphilus]